MKAQNLLLLAVTAILINCTNSNNKTLESGQKLLTVDSIKIDEPLTPRIPSDVDLKFETFIEYFN